MENKGYVIMQMKFGRHCDYKYASDRGIEKTSPSFKPKYVGPIVIGPIDQTDDEYKKSCQFIINKNQNSRGRKYDTVYYLVPKEKMPKIDPVSIKEFYSRSTQEEYMSDFFNSNAYLKALKDSNVLNKCKNLKDLDECIHTKFCYLEPSDYSMLGFPCLDIDSLIDMESSIDTIAINIIVEDFDTNLEELEDGLDKEDFEKLKSELSNLDKTVGGIKEHIMKIRSMVDEDGFYINKKGKKDEKR